MEATLKDLLLQIHDASIESSDSVLSVSLSISQAEVRSTIGLQMVVHAVGTSLLSSSSARTRPMIIAEANTRLVMERCILKVWDRCVKDDWKDLCFEKKESDIVLD